MDRKFISIIIFILLISFALNSTELVIGSDRIVKVNNTFIRVSDLEREFGKRKKLPQITDKVLTKKDVLQSLIDENLILAETTNKHIEAPEEQVNQTLQQYKMLYAQEMLQQNSGFQYTEEEFKNYVEQEIKIPYNDFMQKIKDSIKVKKYVMDSAQTELQKAQNYNYPDSNLRQFYYEHSREFQVPLSVELKHIFLQTVGPNGQPVNKNEKKIVKDRMQDILRRLKNKESFDKLCKLNTQDEASRDYKDPNTDKEQVGYLGVLTVSDDAAKQQFGDSTFYKLFDLKKSSYSSVLESKVGYHIFFVVDKKEPYTMAFSDAKPQIENYLKLMEQDNILKEKYTQIVKNLRKKATITYYKNEYK